ncbi:ClpXP protease specificity-enhancing factor [Aquariibacter albus]|uniref:ClpXP protease specificity-enhancing factor n=1 Tax=Aquariibacter albus TaxID=2759899 RepID=A0A839HSE1_9BURK|nr:ClpXP protease specificity-enhancing factor [Aquariibacter albus]MBB1162538.1 ClpXP protease specificity-enhancing factor [Aquariibacter albus]
MNIPLRPEGPGQSTRPYLIRALHNWCTDNGYTPYLAVHVDASVQVPAEFVKNQEIVLNASFDATSGLDLGNEEIRFKARFGGVPREIVVPVDHVIAIYARENGQGMAFPAPTDPAAGLATTAPLRDANSPAPAEHGLRLAPPPADTGPAGAPADEDPPPPPAGPKGSAGRPALKRIK